MIFWKWMGIDQFLNDGFWMDGRHTPSFLRFGLVISDWMMNGWIRTI